MHTARPAREDLSSPTRSRRARSGRDSRRLKTAAVAGATQREIAKAAGCGVAEVNRHIKVARSVPGTGTRRPLPRRLIGGEEATVRKATLAAKKVLREAPLEQVEQIIADLPPDRQQAVAAAGAARPADTQSGRETAPNPATARTRARRRRRGYACGYKAFPVRALARVRVREGKIAWERLRGVSGDPRALRRPRGWGAAVGGRTPGTRAHRARRGGGGTAVGGRPAWAWTKSSRSRTQERAFTLLATR
jgi:hypothetical protein